MKRLKQIIGVFIIFLISNCTFSETEKVEYIGYYDDNNTKLKMKGELLDDNENGEWVYYNEDATIAQSGTFENGYIVGDWKYYYGSIDSIITWKKWSNELSKYSFSLPSGFIRDENRDIFQAFDSIKNEGIGISDSELKTGENIESYSKLTFDQLTKDFEIISHQLLKIFTEKDNYYYIDIYNLHHKLESSDLMLYNIYTKVNERLFAISFSCSPKDSVRAKFLVGEIYHHLFFKGKRLGNPFLVIKKIEEIR